MFMMFMVAFMRLQERDKVSQVPFESELHHVGGRKHAHRCLWTLVRTTRQFGVD